MKLFLIATLVYTILAFITSLITKIFCSLSGDENSNACGCVGNLLNNMSNQENCTRQGSENAKNNTNNCFNYTYNRYKNF